MFSARAAAGVEQAQGFGTEDRIVLAAILRSRGIFHNREKDTILFGPSLPTTSNLLQYNALMRTRPQKRLTGQFFFWRVRAPKYAIAPSLFSFCVWP